MIDEHAETANVSVKVVPDLSVMRSMLLDMVAVIDKYDDGDRSDSEHSD
ncbi:hypothetical protein [Bifidobacterium rousetti]|nr:hypothetical protein [Bifidobacterium rousetti]